MLLVSQNGSELIPVHQHSMPAQKGILTDEQVWQLVTFFDRAGLMTERAARPQVSGFGFYLTN